MCRVHNAANPERPYSVRELRSNDAVASKYRYFMERIVALERASARVVGYAQVSKRPHTLEKGALNVDVVVDPSCREEGAWAGLYERAERIAKDEGARALKAIASDRDASQLERFRGQGFEEASREIESRLSLAEVGLGELRRLVEATAVEGIGFSTLALERRRNPGCAHGIQAMEDDAGRDVPRTDRWRPIPQLAFEDLVLRGPMVVPSAWFIAVDGGRYVGESYLRRYALTFPRLVTQGFTCTTRDHRGRGIARHLKLLCMLWAKGRGVGQIRTWNDAQNAPMLALNQSLGFRKHATEFKLTKALA